MRSLCISLIIEAISLFQMGYYGITYGMHEHYDDQSHGIVSGRLELTIENERTFVLAPGDRDFLPAGTRHSARVTGDEPVVYLIGAKNKTVA